MQIISQCGIVKAHKWRWIG